MGASKNMGKHSDSYSIQAAGGNSETHCSDFSPSNCADWKSDQREKRHSAVWRSGEFGAGNSLYRKKKTSDTREGISVILEMCDSALTCGVESTWRLQVRLWRRHSSSSTCLQKNVQNKLGVDQYFVLGKSSVSVLYSISSQLKEVTHLDRMQLSNAFTFKDGCVGHVGHNVDVGIFFKTCDSWNVLWLTEIHVEGEESMC